MRTGIFKKVWYVCERLKSGIAFRTSQFASYEKKLHIADRLRCFFLIEYLNRIEYSLFTRM